MGFACLFPQPVWFFNDILWHFKTFYDMLCQYHTISLGHRRSCRTVWRWPTSLPLDSEPTCGAPSTAESYKLLLLRRRIAFWVSHVNHSIMSIAFSSFGHVIDIVSDAQTCFQRLLSEWWFWLWALGSVVTLPCFCIFHFDGLLFYSTI